MSIFTFVVFAEIGDAESLVGSTSPLDQFPGYGEKALDPGRWAKLAALIGMDPTAASRMAQNPPVAVGDEEDGPWVFEVPRDLLDRVSELDAAGVATASKAWVDADRVMAIGGVTYAADVIKRLSDAAARSRAEGKHVLARISL